MARQLLSPKNDIVFKILFTENEDLLKDFTASLLNLPEHETQELTVVNPELPPKTPDLKFSRFDICLRLKTQMLDIEIQRRDELNFRERALYYWASLYTSGLKAGEDYQTLKKTISLNLIDFVLFPEQSSYHIEIVPSIKGTNSIFSEKFSIHFFELSKYRNNLKMNDKLTDSKESMWLQFLNAKTEDEFERLKSFNDPTLNKAIQVVTSISDDPKVNQMVRMREDALHEEASALEDAKQKGIKKGIKKGIQKGIKKGIQKGIRLAQKKSQKRENEMINKLRESGVSEDIIKFAMSMDN